MPLNRRLPKFGFSSPNRQTYQLINLDRLENHEAVKDGSELNAESLRELGLIRYAKLPVKLLGRGELTKKVIITVDKASQSAVDAVGKAGGVVILFSQVSS